MNGKNRLPEEFNKMLKKSLPKDFVKMKQTLKKEEYDMLNIISGTLLFDAVVFMKKMGVLEEFIEDKNEISRMLISSYLKIEKGDNNRE